MKRLDVLSKMMMRRRWFACCLVVVSISLCFDGGLFAAYGEPLSCSVSPEEEQERDPALKEMSYDVGDGMQSTFVYVEPDVTTFYALEEKPPASTKVTPKFNGFAGKFINMSNRHLTLYWQDESGKLHAMRNHMPFTASGTATFPGHRFLFTPEGHPDQVLIRFDVGRYPENIYYYDPYHVEGNPEQTAQNLMALTPEELERYHGWARTLSFHEQYLAFTGRSYLANYLRAPPAHFMWRGDYFGQEHWVTTRETHIVEQPPDEELESIDFADERRILKDDQPRLLQAYRDPTKTILNLTLTAVSVAPRVFSIPNFLSMVEVEHIRNLADTYDLHVSKTGDYNPGETPVEAEDSRRTRTSRNTWVPRERSAIVDAVYRRAADLLRIDEALLRFRGKSEYPDLGTNKPIAESLQLVHYDETQEYTAHHDFGFSRIDDEDQSARFATLLLYLNEGMVGGETSFPRWSNAETFHEYKVTPAAGDAILFYSQLPDGNLDDLSHHAAKPVIEGEKWLCNLWVWSPTYE